MGRNAPPPTVDRAGSSNLGRGNARVLDRMVSALEMPALSGRQKLDFEVMTRRIRTAFKAIGETPDDEADEAMLYNQLIEKTDRLRELIAGANLALDGLGER
jgi:hypothetical protein